MNLVKATILVWIFCRIMIELQLRAETGTAYKNPIAEFFLNKIHPLFYVSTISICMWIIGFRIFFEFIRRYIN